jgi:hypothetical protein
MSAELKPGELAFTTTLMSWGEWRASAFVLGSLDRCIDGPYRDTEKAALAALREQLVRAEMAR